MGRRRHHEAEPGAPAHLVGKRAAAMTHRLLDAIEGYFVARKPRKDSPHTLDAYRNDLTVIGDEIAQHLGTPIAEVTVPQLSLPVMRAAFAEYSTDRAKTTIRRCWSTWHGFFNYLVTEGLLDGNPMAGVARPSAPRRSPKPLDAEATNRLLRSLFDGVTSGRDPWPERDLAVIFTALVTGTRLQEMIDLNIRSFSGDPGNRRITVRGKGDSDRAIPVEPALEQVLNPYLESRLDRFPKHAKRGASPDADPLDRIAGAAPLFVGRDGARIGRGGMQYLVQTVYRRAGVEGTRQKGALVHALRHTFATRLAENPNVTVHELMALMGHRSLSTTQGYVSSTARQLRDAAATNPAYDYQSGSGAPGGPQGAGSA